MTIQKLTGLAAAAMLSVGLAVGGAQAQTAGQDMRSAGHDTKDAARDTGHATKRVTKKAYHKTKHGVKRATHATENAGDRVAGKPATH